ncbi:hypothetical protein BUZ47_00855 [Staphylococcus hominis]|nr:hypothetical protein BUZ47_00855 [Staphylococcus hominis]
MRRPFCLIKPLPYFKVLLTGGLLNTVVRVKIYTFNMFPLVKNYVLLYVLIIKLLYNSLDFDLFI